MADEPPKTSKKIDINVVKDQILAVADKTMHVKVYSPFKIYFDSGAESISAVNDTGPFDILPQHHNFMTLLDPCDLTVRSQGKDYKFRIARGVMHVKANQTIVFLDV